MAKVLYGGGVSNMSGSQAGTTHSRNRGGTYTRQRVTPVQPQTPSQLQVRANLTQLSKAWGSDLTQAQRDAWTALALLYPVIDALGAPVVLTGNQLYVRQNQVLLSAGLSRIDDAPTDLSVNSLLTAVLTADTTPANVLSLAFTPTPLAADDYLQVWLTPALPPGRSFVKNVLRLTFNGAGADASPVNLLASWEAVFGTFAVAGQKIVCQAMIVNSLNGSVSTPLQSVAIVT